MSAKGYSEVYVDHLAESVVAVTRRSPKEIDEVTCVAHLAYSRDEPVTKSLSVQITGSVQKILLFAKPTSQSGKTRQQRSVAYIIPSRHCWLLCLSLITRFFRPLSFFFLPGSPEVDNYNGDMMVGANLPFETLEDVDVAKVPGLHVEHFESPDRSMLTFLNLEPGTVLIFTSGVKEEVVNHVHACYNLIDKVSQLGKAHAVIVL